MGTHLALQITAPSESDARAAEQTAVDEAVRQQRVFSAFDPASDLCRWRSGAVAEPSAELAPLLARAARWQIASAGAFNPMAGRLTTQWLQAVETGIPPSDDELRALAASIAAPRFAAADDDADADERIRRLGDCGDVELNAIAKGHVVDLIAHRVLADHPVSRIVVNAGGDLVHRGDGTLRVAVEDPLRSYDNGAPLLWIEVADAAVATSGNARRWFEVDGRRYSRVLDPRTGRPVDHSASATVIAPDAATADVLATVVSVLDPRAAIDFVARVTADGTPAAVLLVAPDGTEHRSDRWGDHEVTATRG